jgi:hypothetical protein
MHPVVRISGIGLKPLSLLYQQLMLCQQVKQGIPAHAYAVLLQKRLQVNVQLAGAYLGLGVAQQKHLLYQKLLFKNLLFPGSIGLVETLPAVTKQ